jgi:PAS domain S-box-containing protein
MTDARLAGAGAEILAALGEAVVVADREGRIERLNPAGERLFGYPEAELQGMPVTALLGSGADHDLEELALLGGAQGVDFTTTARRRRAPDLAVAISVRVIKGSDGEAEGTAAVIKPVGRWLNPRAGATRRHWERTLGRLLRRLTDAALGDPEVLMRTDALARLLVTHAQPMVPDADVLFSLVPHDRQENFRIIAGAGAWAQAQIGREWPRRGTVAGLSMQLRRPIETVLLFERSNLKHTLVEGEIHTGRLVPLWTSHPLPDGRDAIGVLGFYRSERRYFTPYERHLFGEFARLASLMLQAAELAAAAARSADRLALAVEAAQDFTRSLRAADVSRALVEHAMRAGDADRMTVLRVESGQAAVVGSADREAPPIPVGRRLPLSAWRAPDGTSPVSQAIDANRALAAPGYALEAVERELVVAGLRHTLVLPVMVAGQAPLAMVFDRRRDQPFTAEETAVLSTIGNIAALSLRNTALFEEVEEAGRVKSDFLNMAAHELRTPLTVIRGYVSMLTDSTFGSVPESWRQPLETLRDKSLELGRLIDDLLLAARLETGNLQVAAASIDLNQAAKDAVERFRPEALRLGADVRFQSARRPVVVRADADLVARALDALIANALAYAGSAPPWVRVAVRSREGSGEVAVEDRGRGIAAEEKERVFERFHRVVDAGFPQQPGTGLGLYIGRELAHRMGGRLELEWTRRGEGARFVLAFPELEPAHD